MLMPPQHQRRLLEWTPAAEDLARQERHKEVGAKTLAEVGHNDTSWPRLGYCGSLSGCAAHMTESDC